MALLKYEAYCNFTASKHLQMGKIEDLYEYPNYHLPKCGQLHGLLVDGVADWC